MTGFITLWRSTLGEEWRERHATYEDAVAACGRSPKLIGMAAGEQREWALYVKTYDVEARRYIDLSDEAQKLREDIAEEERWFRNQVPSYAGSCGGRV